MRRTIGLGGRAPDAAAFLLRPRPSAYPALRQQRIYTATAAIWNLSSTVGMGWLVAQPKGWPERYSWTVTNRCDA